MVTMKDQELQGAPQGQPTSLPYSPPATNFDKFRCLGFHFIITRFGIRDWIRNGIDITSVFVNCEFPVFFYLFLAFHGNTELGCIFIPIAINGGAIVLIAYSLVVVPCGRLGALWSSLLRRP